MAPERHGGSKVPGGSTVPPRRRPGRPAPNPGERAISPSKPSGARIHGQIVGTLARDVLGGAVAPGDALPNEDLLAARFAVSRSSVREAVKTLAAKGLIESRQRVGARIRPRADWHMLDPDLLAWHPDILHDRPLMAGLLETRRIIEPAAAELAALRATAEDFAALAASLDAMADAAPRDLEACCEADLAFHGGIIAASRNVVLDGLVATIAAALRASLRATNSITTDQARSVAAHRAVLDALRRRDGAGARAAMNAVLDNTEQDLGAV